MKTKMFQSSFDELRSIILSGPIANVYPYIDKQRRESLEKDKNTFTALMSSEMYKEMDNNSTNEVDDFEEIQVSNDDVIERMSNVISFFKGLAKIIGECSSNLVVSSSAYLGVINRKYHLSMRKYDKKIEREIVNRYRTSYKEIMSIVRDIITYSGFLDVLIKREHKALTEAGLKDLFTIEELQAKKDGLINPNLVDFANDIEAPLIGSFWINKATKVIEDCKQGYFVERTLQKPKPQSKLSEYSEEDLKDIASKRYKFLNQIAKEINERFVQNPSYPHFSIVEYILYISYVRELAEGSVEDPKIQELFESSPEKVALYSSKEVEDFTKEIYAYEEEYNSLLTYEGTEENETFTNDLLTIGAMQDCLQAFYDVKTEMSSIGMLTLATQERANSLLSGSGRWGIDHDKKFDEEDRVGKLLTVDLPGYLKPVSIHIEKLEYDAFKEFDLVKPYKGLFLSGDREYTNSLGVNILFKLSEKEIIKLRQIVNNRKKQIYEGRRQYNNILKRMEQEKNGKLSENQVQVVSSDDSKKKKKQQVTPAVSKMRKEDDKISPNAFMRSLKYEMDVYKVQREMCAIATREYAKWLGKDSIIDDSPLDSI